MTTDDEVTKRMKILDDMGERYIKTGFIQSIPNIYKIPETVFNEIVEDAHFHFDIKRSIPITEWEWNGKIVSKERIKHGYIEVPVFKLNTTIGDFNISTVGSRWRLQTFNVAPYYRPPIFNPNVNTNNPPLIRERDVGDLGTCEVTPTPPQEVTVAGAPRSRLQTAIDAIRSGTAVPDEVMAVAQAVVGNNVINISSNDSPPSGGGPGQYSRELHFNQGIVHLWHDYHVGDSPEGIYFDYETMVFSEREYKIIKDSCLEARQTLSEEEAVAWHYIFCAYYSVLEKE